MSRRGFSRFCTLALLAITPTAVFGQGRVVSRFGETNIGPIRTIVHVTVAVPPGLDGNAVAEEALRGHGARPFQSAEFSLTGLVWDVFAGTGIGPVNQNYNASGEPSNLGGLGKNVIQDARNAWSNVLTSKFRFDGGMPDASRCPSLVSECPGAQTFDGHNDVGWVAISGCCTLAVTWYSTSVDEVDMAFNTRFQWQTGGGNYDVKTIAIHELGHALGLGHSPVAGAVMEATYQGIRSLHEDDIRGVTYLYPEPSGIGNISGRVIANGTGIAGATVSIPEFPAAASVTTGADGTYSLTGIPRIGSYTVTASKSGYASASLIVVTVPSTGLDITLTSTTGGGGGGGCVPKGKGNNCK